VYITGCLWIKPAVTKLCIILLMWEQLDNKPFSSIQCHATWLFAVIYFHRTQKKQG
jgi:hypothetical protein